MTHGLVVAGEISGDRMAAPVLEEMRRRWPDLRWYGAGGERLARAGLEVRHPVDGLAVTGVTEALRRAPTAAALLVDLAAQILRRRPRLALLVDYPGVNLRLAAICRAAGVPVLYLGAPQRWAWLGFRARALAWQVDRLAVTLPFEEQWFRRRGVAATFVGHPLLDLFRPLPRQDARRRLGIAGAVVALLPGSRENEIRRHLPLLVEAARLLPDLAPVLALPPGGAGRIIEQLAPADLPRVDTPLALGAADVALCASGSATLELALAGVPGVVCYRLSPLTYAIARRLVSTRWVGLPNLVLGREVLPELLQDEMTPTALAREARRLLEPAAGEAVRRGLEQVVTRLGRPGFAARVADLAGELLGFSCVGAATPRR
jgi:lipid-A-disaccharide synthase